MKVLVVHNFYQRPGGEDAVVEAEIALLRNAGHSVLEYYAHNGRISGAAGAVLAAFRMPFSFVDFFRLLFLLIKEKPSVVHVHNVFPLISASVFFAAKLVGVKSVYTLHNFRIICPTAMLMHNGAVCETSITRGPWWAIRERVYKNSVIGTACLAATISLHKRIRTWQFMVDRYIALTEFARGKFVEAGLPASKIAVKPNFVYPTDDVVQSGSYFLFVGRLAAEKGLSTLMRAVRHPDLNATRIRIVGDGPLRESLIQENDEICVVLGSRDPSEVRTEMLGAIALVVPSVWYEGFPRVVVEAYAVGLPVIASRLGSLAEVVIHGETGLLFEAGDAVDLRNKLIWAQQNPRSMLEMGRKAKSLYEEHYGPESNLSRLETIYGWK